MKTDQVRSKGFTLIETLLAVTLFTVVASSSTGVFSAGVQIWKRSQGRGFHEQRAMIAMERIGQDVRAALQFRESSKGEEPSFEGGAGSFDFPAMVAEGEMFQYGRIGYEYRAGAKELCRVQESATDLYRARGAPCRVMARYVEDFDFRYLLMDAAAQKPVWTEKWEFKQGLPYAVKVRLRMKDQFPGEKKPTQRAFERTYWVPVGGKK